MSEINESYQIKKSLWTESDFDEMGWHDSLIYGFIFSENYELILDIDYIFHWVQPKGDIKYFKFWVSPCTLIFENVNNLKFDIEISEPFELEIADIHRDNPTRPKNADYIKRDTEYNWIIETQQGEITFKAVGFKQFVRILPILLDRQNIEFENRNGISFERQAATVK